MLRGRVRKKAMKNAVVVERVITHYVRKYKRYLRRRTRISAHIPPCIQVEEGDEVQVAECRPISKTISYVVLGRLARGGRGV